MAPVKKSLSGVGGVAVAVVLLLIASLLLWRQVAPSRPAPVVRSMYYYDLDAEKLFVAGSDQVPPFTTDTGGQAVAAHVFTCGACTDDERFVAFFTKYDDATRDTLAAMTLEERTYATTDVQMLMQEGQLIRGSDQQQWLPFDSEAAMSILQSPALRCGGPGAPVLPCEPSGID